MKKTNKIIYKVISNSNRTKWSLALRGILVGAFTGFLAAIYRAATQHGVLLATQIYAYIKAQPLLILPWCAAAVAAGLLIAWLIKLEPMAAGGGVPQVEGVIRYGFKMKWYAILIVRYIAGILGAVFGLSFGPEGPCVQIGAAAGDALSKKIGSEKIEKEYLVTGGAAAGLTAAFGAPLSGIMFTLEEVHRSFSPFILLCATAASLVSAFISKCFFGLKPALLISTVPVLPIRLYPWLLPLAIVSGLAGFAVNKGLLLFQTLYGRLPRLIRPVLALILALPCGLLLPQVLGGGGTLISVCENASPILFIMLLFIVKLIFTCTSFGSGTPGGIFMPIISIGALAGSVFGSAAVYFGFPAHYVPVFVVCAMAGALSASIKAPVTAIVLTVEITGSFLYILPVAACTFIALAVSDVLGADPIYEALLERFAEKTGKKLITQESGEIAECPVELGSSICSKTISQTAWPQGMLILGVRRGEHTIVPNGGTKILAGDYLVLLLPQENGKKTLSDVRTICQGH